VIELKFEDELSKVIKQ